MIDDIIGALQLLASLDKGAARVGATRLATDARNLAECDTIPVTGH